LPRIPSALLATVLAVGIGGCAPNGGTAASGSTASSSAAFSSTAASSPPTLPTIPFAPSTTSQTPTPEASVDYQRLLLAARDLTDADDTFTERSKQSDPNGNPGASAFFVNGPDTRAISVTFLVYPDAATAAATLKQAAGTLPTLVAGGTPKPLAVGADGVAVSGTIPNEDKAVTLVFFAEGRALARLEFQSAAGDPTTDKFVENVSKMQDVALRVGLTDPQ
jgi:hypothetical protein